VAAEVVLVAAEMGAGAEAVETGAVAEVAAATRLPGTFRSEVPLPESSDQNAPDSALSRIDGEQRGNSALR